VYWAKALKSRKPNVIVLENVEEFQKWGPLIPKVDERGKPVLTRTAADHGAVPGAQGRDVPPLQAAASRTSATRSSTASWWRGLRRADQRKRLFLIARCDGSRSCGQSKTHGPGRAGCPWRPAAECIDFAAVPEHLRAQEAAGREHAEAHRARHRAFVKKDPFIVPVMHAGDARVHSLDEPMRTITARTAASSPWCSPSR
jgi:DNA (cytosine-5)-methyltransferase 1